MSDKASGAVVESQRVETKLIVTKGSDGNVYDLHGIAHRSRPEAGGSDASWTDEGVEWLTSGGAVVERLGERTFRLGDIVMTTIADLDGSKPEFAAAP